MNESTPRGTVEISPTAIASIAGQAVLESYGVVGMAPRRLREGLTEMFPRAYFRKGVQVRVEGGQIKLDLYVVVEYGTRISEVAQGLMNRVKYTVEHAVGLPVIEVNVHVQGLRVSEST